MMRSDDDVVAGFLAGFATGFFAMVFLLWLMVAYV